MAVPRKSEPVEDRKGRTSVKDQYDYEAWQAWDNEPKLNPGRPYDGAIVRDGQLIIPN